MDGTGLQDRSQRSGGRDARAGASRFQACVRDVGVDRGMGAEQDQPNASEWRMPAAASGALQLSSRLARPAAWAGRLDARSRPLVLGAFGAEIAGRFSTVGASGVLAQSLGDRFLPSQARPFEADL